MKFNRNSLFVKSIFYNDVAIILSSFIVFLTMSFILFWGQNNRLPGILNDSNKKITTSYNHFITDTDLKLKEIIDMESSREILSKIDDLYTVNKYIIEETPEKQENLKVIENISSSLLSLIISGFFEDSYISEEPLGISLADKNGNIISETLKFKSTTQEIYSLDKKNNNFKINIFNKKNFSYYDYIAETDELVSRTYVETKTEFNNIKYVIISTIVKDNFLEKLREYVRLDKGIKLFVLYDGVYIVGELDIKKGKNFFSSLGFLNSYGKKSEERVINGKVYSITYVPIKNSSEKIIGFIGIAMSKYTAFEFSIAEYGIAILVILCLMIVMSYVFGKVYRRQFEPINELINCSKEIANGNFDVKIKVRAEGEIRALADSMKNMINLISKNQRILETENETLRNQISRINMMEKLLLNIHSEDNVDNIIFFILSALTSELGLDYGRAIYLEYDNEQEMLKGRSSATNIKFIDNENEYFKFQSGLKLHSESLNKVVKLITIDLDDNIVADAFKSCEIVYHNDRGFKFKLGSDLLTSLGLNNFILFPIFTGKKSYGIIIIDQSMTKKPDQVNDIELLQLLSMNISIHFKNKELEKEKLNSEKDTTISYLTSKILREIQSPTDLVKDIINDYNQYDYIDREKLHKIQNSVIKINNLSTSVLEYADTSHYNFEKLDLKEIVDKSIENIKPILKNSVIELSKLYTHKNSVIANSKKLETAVTQVLLNAIEAVDKVGGMLNITTKNKSGGVQIKITDNGDGVEERVLKKLFDPFYGTKGSSGLGLAIAKKIISEHGGEIRIKSEPNKGTEVRILLNIYEEE